MAVLIPNSTETTSGNPFASLDQAEPDSLDFEIVGNTGRGGVLSGCGVTTLGVSSAISVAAGTVVIDGKSYSLAGPLSVSLPSAPSSDTRFDVVVARIVSGTSTAIATSVAGVESATNPTYPTSDSIDGGGLIDFDTDAVLAVCLRVAGGIVTVKEIVDKRAMVSSTVFLQGTALPATAPNGTQFFLTNETTSGTGVLKSGLYFRANGSWLALAQDNSWSQVPIGMSYTWRGESAVPSTYLEENGQAVSRTVYAELFAVIGTRYGAGDSSSTFNVPNGIGRTNRGYSGSLATLGNTGGANTAVLNPLNMPSHRHGMTHNHVYSHTHSFSATSGNGGSHGHTDSFASAGSQAEDHAHDTAVSIPGGHSYLFRSDDNDSASGTSIVNVQTGSGLAVRYQTGASALDLTGRYSGVDEYGMASGNHSHSITGAVNSASSHAHSVSGTTNGPNSSTTNYSTKTSTDYDGSGEFFSIANPYIDGIPVIKALGG